MKLTVAAVGRVRAKHFGAACDDYAKRLTRYATLDIKEVKDSRGDSPARIAARDSENLLAALPQRSFVVALDERGEQVGSMELARRIDDAMTRGVSSWSFCLGGAEGHSDALRSSADWVWSLSALTMPHELARVVLLEQLYRAMTILRGEKYHREG